MKDNLFKLISTMTKSERIYYARYANSSKKTAQHIKVFKTIIKHKIQTNNELTNRINDRDILVKLSHIKKYLFNSIIDHILFYKRKNYYNDGVYSLLRSKLMFSRGLINESIDNQDSVLNKFEGLTVPYSQGLYLSNAHYTISVLQSQEIKTGYRNEPLLELAKKNLKQVDIYKEYHELILLHLEFISNVKNNNSIAIEEKLKFARNIAQNSIYFQDDYKILSINNTHLRALCFFHIFSFLGKLNLLLKKLEIMYSDIEGLKDNQNKFEGYDALRHISYTLASVSSSQNDKLKFEVNINRLAYHNEQLQLDTKVNRDRLNEQLIFELKLQFAFNNQDYKMGTHLKDEILNFHKTRDCTDLIYHLILCFLGENDSLNAFQLISPELDEKVKKYDKAPYLLYSISKVLIFLGNKHYSSALSEIRSLAYITKKESDNKIYQHFAPVVHALHKYSRYCFDNDGSNHSKLSKVFEQVKLLTELNTEEIKAFQKLLSNWFIHQLDTMQKTPKI